MVFAAGRGMRMRPLTETIPKPLIKVGGKPMIDHLLDRFALAGVGTAVVNVHHLADQIEAHLANHSAPKVVISDERDLLLDQGGAIKKALPILGDAPFFLCNTDAFWVEGAKPNLDRLATAWNPDEMDVLLLVAATPTSSGIDWPGDFTMDGFGRLTNARRGASRLSSIPASASSSRSCSRARRRDRFAYCPISSRPPRPDACTACGSTASGCMSARPRRSTTLNG